MTDSSPLNPEQEAVRRLLADARHDGPTPPDVVARLDETLASLVSERQAPPQAATATMAPVVDLGARRRRRAGIGLLAAAAVVVAGVAIGQGLPRTSGSNAGSSSAADSADSATSGAQDDSDGSGAGGSATEMAPEARKNSSTAPLAGYLALSTTDAGLEGELVDLRARGSEGAAGLDSVETQLGCDLTGLGRGRRVVAQIDGQVGVVVFRRSTGADQKVDLYVCGLSLPVRTVTLPAP